MPTPFSLEEAMKQLETIETYFQQPSINFEEALAKHKEAIALADRIMEYLDKTENTLKSIDIAAAKASAAPAEVSQQ